MRGSKYYNPLRKYKKILFEKKLFSLVPLRDIKIAKQLLVSRFNRIETYKRRLSKSKRSRSNDLEVYRKRIKKVRESKLQNYEDRITKYQHVIVLLRAKESYYRDVVKKKIKEINNLIERIEKQL